VSFYTFNQNNSGGSFEFDKRHGISHYVIVEGDSLADVTAFAERIGLYWDGCENGRDCSCCGDRWSRPWDGEKLDEVPSIYGEPIGTAKAFRWMGDRPEGFVHYKDGTVEPFNLKER
jgi:hypothetical protein